MLVNIVSSRTGSSAARRLLKEKEEALQAAEEQRRLEQVGNTRSGFTIST